MGYCECRIVRAASFRLSIGANMKSTLPEQEGDRQPAHDKGVAAHAPRVDPGASDSPTTDDERVRPNGLFPTYYGAYNVSNRR